MKKTLPRNLPMNSIPLIAFTLFLSLAGCAAIQTTQAPATYYQTLERWTKGKKVFEGLESRLHVYAAYKSLAYRKAYVDEYSRRYALDEDMKNLLLEREVEAHQMYNEFFMAAYTPVIEWNDFEKDNSIWRLYLEDKAGTRLVPAVIKKIDSKDPLYREFFPFFDPWSYGYIVRFPRYGAGGAGPVGEKESGFLKLTITGIEGSAELVWQLVEPE